jgi:hypothetical protein
VSSGNPEGDRMSEEELRAAYEAELKKIRVDQVLLENVVSLINLGMRRTGLAPGTEDERDLGQVQVAVDSIRALLPILEQVAPAESSPIRDALSQLQLAFVRLGGAPTPGAGSAGGEQSGGGPGEEQGGGPGGGPGGPGGGPAGGPDGPDPTPPERPAQPEPPKPGEPGPAQRSGRLWVPGQ